MTSSRPYLIRAIHDWILDNELTPYLLVNAEVQGVVAPPRSVHDGKITFNLSPSATKNLLLGNEQIEFLARFGGVSTHVRLPTQAVLAVYAKETGVGMAFPEEVLEEAEERSPSPVSPDLSESPEASKPNGDTRPNLRLVE